MLYGSKVNIVVVFSAVLSAAWFIIDGFILPPAFGSIDIYYFKDSGINFAQGLGLVTRFTFGNPTFEYQGYSQYPPVYPLLFGFFVKIFGTSAFTNQLFNSVVSLVLGLACFFALKPAVSGHASRFIPYILAAVLAVAVFAGFFCPVTDRPDGLAVFFGLLAFIALNRGNARQNEFIAGVFCAIAMITSPFAGIWTSIAVAIVVVARHYPEGGLRPGLMGLVFAALGAFLVTILLGAAVATFLPGWFFAFLGVVTGVSTHNETGGGYFLALLRGDFRTWASGFEMFSEFYVAVAKLLAVQGALAGAIILTRSRYDAGRHAWPFVGLLAASPLCLIVAPYQVNYPAITAALLLAAAASVTAGLPLKARRLYATAILTGFGLVSMLSVPFKSREAILRIGTRPSLERALNYIDANRTVFDRPGQLFAVSPTSYILWRQAGMRPLISVYSGFDKPENRKNLTYVAVTYPGSHNPLLPDKPRWLTDDEYRLEYQPDLPQLASILGMIASSSSQTWESAIYAKRNASN